MKSYHKIVSKRNFFFDTVEQETMGDDEILGAAQSQHYHNVFELYLLDAGACRYFIDSRAYSVRAGDLVLIPEGVIHRTMYGKGYYRRHLLHLSRYDIPASVLPVLSSVGYVYRNPETEGEVRALFSQIEEEWRRDDAYSDELLREYTHLLFYLIARNSTGAERPPAARSYIESAVKYLQTHFGGDVTLSQVAALYSVSREHFSRLFKRETGFGFNEYLTLLRLQKAETMLREEPEKNVSQVAYETGFNDSNYFSDRFHREYGLSPLKYRRARQGMRREAEGREE
ncbi:MAG: helix-turn-helix transcriptional regulator [Clostridia bacterium]|nr:helix-turn-helix transcriptional regulator [Clostridia bacterium]